MKAVISLNRPGWFKAGHIIEMMMKGTKIRFVAELREVVKIPYEYIEELFSIEAQELSRVYDLFGIMPVFVIVLCRIGKVALIKKGFDSFCADRLMQQQRSKLCIADHDPAVMPFVRCPETLISLIGRDAIS